MSKRFERNVIKFLEMLHYSEEMGGTKKFKKRYCKDEKEYNHLIDYLLRKKLVKEIWYEETRIFQLTDNGIEFVIGTKKEKRQEEFNKMMAFTGAILALIGIYQFFSDLGLINRYNWITAIFVILALGSMGKIISFLIGAYFNRL
jgi:hypothetical protein